MEMDVEGFTVLEGRKGRTLTEQGLDRMKTLEKDLRQQSVNSQLIQMLNHSGEKALLDVLVARRALEREIVSLAKTTCLERIHSTVASIYCQPA